MQTPFLSTADSCRSFIIFDTPSIDDTWATPMAEGGV
jgi:hypothetical protein